PHGRRVRERLPRDGRRAVQGDRRHARHRRRQGHERRCPVTAVVILLVVLGFALLMIVTTISRLTYICPPNEVLIFSGKRTTDETGRSLGYRLVQGGRAVRRPMIESVDRISLANMIIDLRVQGAYSKGGIPLNVQGVANVKVSSKTSELANAIERFL